MTATTIDLDPHMLDEARTLSGAHTDDEVVRRALHMLITVRRQPASVERILARGTRPADPEDEGTDQGRIGSGR